MYSLWQDLSVHTRNFDLVTLTLTFDLLLKKLNLGHNFWTKSDWALILHIYIPCGKTSLMIPIFLPCGLDLDFDLLMEKLELVAAGGISPVRTDPDLVYYYFYKWFIYSFIHLCPCLFLYLFFVLSRARYPSSHMCTSSTVFIGFMYRFKSLVFY